MGAPARRRGKRGGAANGIGRSRGGPSTKVHLVVDALGLPLTFEVTEGQRDDIVPAKELASRARSRCLVADKAHGASAFRASLEAARCTPVIPWNRSRAASRSYDKELSKARSEIACTFNLLKQARRFATRYEKTLRNYAAVVALGCTMALTTHRTPCAALIPLRDLARPSAMWSTTDIDARVNGSARWLRPRGRPSITRFAKTRKSRARWSTSSRS